MTAAHAIAALSPHVLARALVQPTAAERAQMTWQYKALGDALRRLASGPLDQLHVDDAVVAFVMASRALPVRTLEPAKVAAMHDFLSLRVRAVGDGLADEGAADALEWTGRRLKELLAIFASPQLVENIANDPVPHDDDIRTMLTTDAGSLLRAEVLLLACLEADEIKVPAEALTELAWLAFDETCKTMDALAADGFVVPPQEDPAATAPSVLRAVRGLRQGLSIADMKQLKASRSSSASKPSSRRTRLFT